MEGRLVGCCPYTGADGIGSVEVWKLRTPPEPAVIAVNRAGNTFIVVVRKVRTDPIGLDVRAKVRRTLLQQGRSR